MIKRVNTLLVQMHNSLEENMDFSEITIFIIMIMAFTDCSKMSNMFKTFLKAVEELEWVH